MFYLEYGNLGLYALLYELRLAIIKTANILKNRWSI